MNSKYFLIRDCCDTKADDKMLKFYDRLQLFAEVVLLIRYDEIYCIFAKVQSFLLRVSE